jgi:hypothetical protein
MLNTIRAYDSRFKIYAWIGSYPHDASGQIDLSTSGYRQAMINSVVACAQKGFDGIQDNIEDVTAGTTYANQVTYWNALTTALHGVGKECIVYTLPWDWNVNYWSTINADYIAMSMYAFDGTPDSEADFKYYMDLALTKTTSPCLLSMIHGGTGETIADQLGWIGDQITLHGTYSNLAGFALYEYSGILSSEWAAWDTFIAG